MELGLLSIIPMIRFADEHELSLIVCALIERYRSLHPDEEVIFLSLPLDVPEEREAILRHAVELFRQS